MLYHRQISYTVAASLLISCTLSVHNLIFRFKKYRFKKKTNIDGFAVLPARALLAPVC
jgi:hypothetical protein